MYMKQLAFLTISSTPTPKKYCTNFKPLFQVESTYFPHFLYIYLKMMGWSTYKNNCENQSQQFMKQNANNKCFTLGSQTIKII